VAKGTGRSFSNAYQILEALQRLGAVLVEEGTRRLYRALPIEDLVANMKQRLDDQARQAITMANEFSPSVPDQKLWEIKTVDQVYEIFRRMLRECDQRALIELFPEPFEHLKDSLEKGASRGLTLVARIYEPAEIQGVRTVLSPFGKENLKTWGSQWMSLYVDGRQYLQATLENKGNGVRYAVWSENLYISRTLYSYLNSDLHHYSFRNLLDHAESVKELRRAYLELQDTFPPGGDLGYKELLQYGKDPS